MLRGLWRRSAREWITRLTVIAADLDIFQFTEPVMLVKPSYGTAQTGERHVFAVLGILGSRSWPAVGRTGVQF
jgi:hypothetical protein